MIAALYVETAGVYYDLPGVDPWDVERDARSYAGSYPVVAHPPCERWGRYWSGGPSARERRRLGDDAGCFRRALRAVCRFGGVLEHPEASHAFRIYGINTPPKSGGWVPAFDDPAEHGIAGRIARVCCVEQGHYGHPARKATWLLYVGSDAPLDLAWGKSNGRRLDEGFHSREERQAARAAGVAPRKRLSTAENLATPIAFRDVLIALARHSEGSAAALDVAA